MEAVSTSNHSMGTTNRGDPQQPDSTTKKQPQLGEVFSENSYKASSTSNHQMGDVVVLVGTSTAGKTSLVKALKQLEPDRVEDSIDLRMAAACLNLLKHYCPSEVAFLERTIDPADIPNAVFTPEQCWKEGISEAEKIQAIEILSQIKQKMDALPQHEMDLFFKDVDLQMIDSAFENSRQGTRVVFDVLARNVADVDRVARHALTRQFEGPMAIVLVYCPFHMLTGRMEQRNREAEESGHLANKRSGTFPLMQFSRIYTHDPEDPNPLEIITRDQAIKAFTENDPTDNASQLKEFLENLGFTDDLSEVRIAPRNKSSYDRIINSGSTTAQDSAKLIQAHRKC